MDGADADLELARCSVDAEAGVERPFDPLDLFRFEGRPSCLLGRASETGHDPFPKDAALELSKNGDH